jgi:hypothetical protein
MKRLQMKMRGQYMSRMLSFAGAEFDVVEQKVDAEFQVNYDLAVEFWADLIEVLYDAMNQAYNEGETSTKYVLCKISLAQVRCPRLPLHDGLFLPLVSVSLKKSISI